MVVWILIIRILLVFNWKKVDFVICLDILEVLKDIFVLIEFCFGIILLDVVSCV